jgi:hypothetical protein
VEARRREERAHRPRSREGPAREREAEAPARVRREEVAVAARRPRRALRTKRNGVADNFSGRPASHARTRDRVLSSGVGLEIFRHGFTASLAIALILWAGMFLILFELLQPSPRSWVRDIAPWYVAASFLVMAWFAVELLRLSRIP